MSKKYDFREVKKKKNQNLLNGTAKPKAKPKGKGRGPTGRPAKKKAERLTKKVTVNFTEKEFEALQKLATNKDLDLTIPLPRLIRQFLKKDGRI